MFWMGEFDAIISFHSIFKTIFVVVANSYESSILKYVKRIVLMTILSEPHMRFQSRR